MPNRATPDSAPAAPANQACAEHEQAGSGWGGHKREALRALGGGTAREEEGCSAGVEIERVDVAAGGANGVGHAAVVEPERCEVIGGVIERAHDGAEAGGQVGAHQRE